MISPNTNVFVSSYKVIEFTDGNLQMGTKFYRGTQNWLLCALVPPLT